MAKKKYSVFLVDDSEDDRWFLRRALSETGRFVVVGEASDGEAAISYLRGEGAFGNREKYPLPEVLLLDLKMPRVTGHEVLRWLQHESFKGMFVAVVSGSILPDDIALSLALGANAHYQKGALHEQQMAMIEAIEQALEQTEAPR